MKFVVLQENLKTALSSVLRTVSSRPQLPVLSNVLLEAKKEGLYVAGTDLEMGILVKVGGKIEENGKVTVPARMFSEFVTSLPAGKIEAELKGETLSVDSGSYHAEFQTIPADEFPSLPKFSDVSKDSLKVAFSSFSKVSERVLYAAARDSMRPVLTGMLFEFSKKNLRLVATDGFRLSRQEFSEFEGTLPESSIVVPSRAVSETIKVTGAEDIRIAILKESNQIVFVIGDVLIVSQLLDGSFPDYNKIIPEGFSSEFLVSREELLEAINVSQVFARDNSSVLQWEVDSSGLSIMSESSELGKNTATVQIELTGDASSIAFNGRFLQDFLQTSSSSRIWFGMNDSLAPGAFREEGDETFLYIVMPINL